MVNTLVTTPRSTGWRDLGATEAMTIMVPLKSPLAPMPVIALPIIKVTEDFATPHTMLLTKNTSTYATNTGLWEKLAKKLPARSWQAQMAMRKDEPYQLTSSRELNSVVMVGTAVATMVKSYIFGLSLPGSIRSTALIPFQLGALKGKGRPPMRTTSILAAEMAARQRVAFLSFSRPGVRPSVPHPWLLEKGADLGGAAVVST
jgi:hypothetical protein